MVIEAVVSAVLLRMTVSLHCVLQHEFFSAAVFPSLFRAIHCSSIGYKSVLFFVEPKRWVADQRSPSHERLPEQRRGNVADCWQRWLCTHWWYVHHNALEPPHPFNRLLVSQNPQNVNGRGTTNFQKLPWRHLVDVPPPYSFAAFSWMQIFLESTSIISEEIVDNDGFVLHLLLHVHRCFKHVCLFLCLVDVAFCDDEGDFWIVDRLKELIKYKGFQVSFLLLWSDSGRALLELASFIILFNQVTRRMYLFFRWSLSTRMSAWFMHTYTRLRLAVVFTRVVTPQFVVGVANTSSEFAEMFEQF